MGENFCQVDNALTYRKDNTFLKLNNKKTDIPVKNKLDKRFEHFSKEVIWMGIGTWKHAQHY